MRRTTLPFDRMNFPLTLTDQLRAAFVETVCHRSRDGCPRSCADRLSITTNARKGNPAMEQAEQEHRAILIVEDDAALRSLAAALFEDEQVNTIECEGAEAALAILLIGGRDVAMIFADIRLPGAMDGVDLAWEAEAALAPSSDDPHLGASARARRRTAALGGLHAQAVAAAQRADCRRTGISVCAKRLVRPVRRVSNRS